LKQAANSFIGHLDVRSWREADIRRKFQDPKGYWQTGMLLEALSRDNDRIAQVGRIAREQAHAAGVPCYYIDESSDPEGRSSP
jgi:hypothetical protein